MKLNIVEVLLIEDNISDAELVIRELKKHKLANNLHHVRDGAEAIDLIFSTGKYSINEKIFKPKVMLLDIQMPKMNGIEVLEKIKGDERTKTIPVVMLTSSKEDSDIKRCYELGANSYIVKPMDFEDFAAAIKSLGLYWLLLNQRTNY